MNHDYSVAKFFSNPIAVTNCCVLDRGIGQSLVSSPARLGARLFELLNGGQMTAVNIIIGTVDKVRTAEVSLSNSQTGGDLIQAAIDNWSLPKDADYSLVNTRTSTPIQLSESLGSQGVRDGDVLEVQPVTDTALPQTPSMKWTDKSRSPSSASTVSRVIAVCPNCNASLSVPAERSSLVSCPFCNRIFGSAQFTA